MHSVLRRPVCGCIFPFQPRITSVCPHMNALISKIPWFLIGCLPFIFLLSKNHSERDANDIVAHVVVAIVAVWTMSFKLIRALFISRFSYSHHPWCEQPF